MSQDYDSKLTPLQGKNKKEFAIFSAKVRSRFYNLHRMKIQDPFHALACALTLKIEKDGSETAAVCQFSTVPNKSNKFLDEDEDLYGIIAIQLQMNMLKQRFLFCANHEASQLTIYMDKEL